MMELAGAECRGDDGHCITCGDQGIAVRVLGLTAGTARCVDEHGAIHAVAVDLIGDVRPGDRLLTHAGVALSRMEGALGAPGQERLDAEQGAQNAGLDAPWR